MSFGAELADPGLFPLRLPGAESDHLTQNPKVCVEADTFLCTQTLHDGITTRCESVIGFGTCQIVTNPEEMRHDFRLLEHYGYCGHPP